MLRAHALPGQTPPDCREDERFASLRCFVASLRRSPSHLQMRDHRRPVIVFGRRTTGDPSGGSDALSGGKPRGRTTIMPHQLSTKQVFGFVSTVGTDQRGRKNKLRVWQTREETSQSGARVRTQLQSWHSVSASFQVSATDTIHTGAHMRQTTASSNPKRDGRGSVDSLCWIMWQIYTQTPWDCHRTADQLGWCQGGSM